MRGIGRLRHRLVHETPSETPDGQGGTVRGFVTAGRFWGAIATQARTELVADRPVAVLTHEVTLRAPAPVQPGDRLRLGGRVFAVETVSDPNGRGRHLLCRCREETP